MLVRTHARKGAFIGKQLGFEFTLCQRMFVGSITHGGP